MQVFITGASGWIGSALTRDLVGQGHEVTGLARSDASAERIRSAGARPVRGDVADHALIVEQARRADATAHLAFTLDFDAFDETIDNEVALLAALADALADSGKAFFAASGTPTNPTGVATEDDALDPDGPAGARSRTAAAVLALADRGIRSGLVRMPRTVHGAGDRNGLIASLVQLDRQLGVAAFVGDGANRWPAVHVEDAARLFRLALESAPPRSVLHAVAEEGVPMRAVAESVSRQTGLPAQAVDPATLGVFGALLGGDQPASSARTRALLGWEPTGPTLLEDLDAGYYTTSAD
ncbi:SDR family oxidoreductase [Curtobacterium sp. 458]|uniref:SDR family oxidoreductase n=1 Tax=Curtobacterium sp. 458 TaxID=3050069 RepID=UPI0025B45A37|nr:SDR family oxidoreductase [Curtobacterium sp. 458]WJY00374.1 SDR family oxidoreductase [Curtobacterium sp. 458]